MHGSLVWRHVSTHRRYRSPDTWSSTFKSKLRMVREKGLFSVLSIRRPMKQPDAPTWCYQRLISVSRAGELELLVACSGQGDYDVRIEHQVAGTVNHLLLCYLRTLSLSKGNKCVLSYFVVGKEQHERCGTQYLDWTGQDWTASKRPRAPPLCGSLLVMVENSCKMSLVLASWRLVSCRLFGAISVTVTLLSQGG